MRSDRHRLNRPRPTARRDRLRPNTRYLEFAVEAPLLASARGTPLEWVAFTGTGQPLEWAFCLERRGEAVVQEHGVGAPPWNPSPLTPAIVACVRSSGEQEVTAAQADAATRRDALTRWILSRSSSRAPGGTWGTRH